MTTCGPHVIPFAQEKPTTISKPQYADNELHSYVTTFAYFAGAKTTYFTKPLPTPLGPMINYKQLPFDGLYTVSTTEVLQEWGLINWGKGTRDHILPYLGRKSHSSPFVGIELDWCSFYEPHMDFANCLVISLLILEHKHVLPADGIGRRPISNNDHLDIVI